MPMIGEEQSFSMQAYVESPGFVRMVPTGGIVRRDASGTYVGGLLPQMFLGADGKPLTSWRQYIGSSGAQTILSKPAGSLLVPKQDVYWRRISGPSTAVFKQSTFKRQAGLQVPVAAIAIIGVILASTVILWIANKK